MKWNKYKLWSKKYPLTFSIAFSVIVGILLAFVWVVWQSAQGGTFLRNGFGVIGEIGTVSLTMGFVLGIFCFLPLCLTGMEVYAFWKEWKGKESEVELKHIDLITIGVGILYNLIFFSFLDGVMFESDWHVVLYNGQKHTPIFTESYLTIWFLIIIALAGYLIVHLIPIDKIPPLTLVLGFSSMYMGTFLSIVWFAQVFQGKELPEACLILLPLCCICITARTVLHKMKEYRAVQESGVQNTSSILNKCNQILSDSAKWPIVAFLLMWPLLGILIGILVLFGQEPDAVIKAWTETADWNLSQRIAPQNLYMDEHYLCTVAAGGHEKIVKPIRLGVRHGHEVIVNRQLCIANAFEQILEEKTPKFHKMVRRFYDTYGFPIGKWIMKSRLAADFTYFVMKPLEWMFLAVIYLVDSKPENRIAIQYTGKVFEKKRCLASEKIFENGI